VASYLYGLILSASASRVPAGIRGIDGGDVRVVAPAGSALTGIASDLARVLHGGNLVDVRAHDDALRAIVDAGVTVAASRFGQTFDDDDALRAAVADAADRIVGALQTFDGAVEMRVLVAAEPAAVPPARPSRDDRAQTPGRAYLEQLRQRLEPSALSLRSALGPVVRAERVEHLAGGRGVAFAHLVARDDVGAYREAVAALPALSDATVVGPLPLYSFTGPEHD
jgi:hypothetical protein